MINSLSIYCDGGARGNPGPGAYGFVVIENKIIVYKESGYIGHSTNNQAEYTAVLKAWKWLIKNIKNQNIIINFMLDSELVTKQLNGFFKIKSNSLKNIYFNIKESEKISGLKFTYRHIYRKENKFADNLVNSELDKKTP